MQAIIFLLAFGLGGWGMPDYTPTAAEVQEIADIVWLEARGEPADGQQAVAEVVLNRVQSDRFPDNVIDVIYQPGQFTPAGVTANPTAEQYKAVCRAMYGRRILPEDAVYFSGAAQNSRVCAKIGGHVFCCE